jgi:peptidoglycan/xylan/chitin deacetylase (PgdA/CDA1 family)
MAVIGYYILFLFLAFLIYFFPVPLRYLQQAKLQRKCSQKKYLVLSYDDGPGKNLTPKLLELLAEHNIKATFFPLGKNIEQHPQIVEKIIAAGHEIGCHGYNHVNAWKNSPWKAIADIKLGLKSLSFFNTTCSFFRPPHGKVVFPTWWLLKKHNLQLGWWTKVSGDTYNELPDPADFVEDVIRNGGGVVLLHDIHRSEERIKFVLKTTDLLITKAKESRLSIKPLGSICTSKRNL